jgi:hypothetical protein
MLALSKQLTTTLIVTILAVSTMLAAFPMASAEISFAPTLDPTSGPPGTKVTVSAGAGGASPFATVTAYWDNLSGKVLNSTSADSTGAYEMNVTIPSAVNGEHWIVVNDGESESRGAAFNVTAGLVVTNYYLGVVLPVGNGEVYVNGTLHTGDNVEFKSGEVANITAVPASGWTFDRWAFGQGGTSNPWYLTMTENMAAWAVFEEIPPEGNGDNTSFEVTTHNVTLETNTYVIEAFSNSSVSEFVFNGTAIRFHVDGAPGTAGFCNATIPSELMSGDFSIYKDDTLLIKDVDYTGTYNGTHYLFSITYEHSTHTIEIMATIVIPEFSSLIMLSLLSLVTLTIIIFKKKFKCSRDYGFY